MAITFTPEDFDSVTSIEELTRFLNEIIIDIRTQSINYKELITEIQSIEKINNDSLNKNSDINELFFAYEQIKKISMQLRSLLQNFINLEVYDEIEYVFYYNGKRYYTQDIKASWLIKNSSGQLRLDLEKAAMDLKEGYNDLTKIKIQELFSNHYLNYLQAIEGMYLKTNKKRLGQGRLNKGHVAEAFESHLAEHHGMAYTILNSFSIESTVDKNMISQFEKETNIRGKLWKDHESSDEAWIHIRGALGTQRGTVAGDVGSIQVKQGGGNSKYGNIVRLSSLTNLKTGIKRYCDILNTDIPSNQVARAIAMYMTEPVKKTEQNLQALIANSIGKNLQDMTLIRHI